MSPPKVSGIPLLLTIATLTLERQHPSLSSENIRPIAFLSRKSLGDFMKRIGRMALAFAAILMVVRLTASRPASAQEFL
jgi:hypothetical protein